MMGKVKWVIVYGNTLVLAGIAASMNQDPEWEGVCHAIITSQEELYSLHPDIVIFDLDAVQPDFYSLVQELPGLVLIGVDPKTNRVVLWSGQQVDGLSNRELAQVIHQINFNIPISRREK